MNYLLDYSKMTRISFASIEAGIVLLESRLLSFGYKEYKYQLQRLLQSMQGELEKVRTIMHEEVESRADELQSGAVAVSEHMKSALARAPTDVDISVFSKLAAELPIESIEVLKKDEAENLALIDSIIKPLQEELNSLVKRIERV